ncbi:PREDICTED: nuclear factor NF-kappa-B p110 subunit [Ceratosolen solmsi marchali]|uniref:Nuclear factor NF-kappa-B p110 subunit n=1 Tax=Ceratosolen solmsi marchali TaxID=326594 RepID=A0AAJ6YCP9_9HYME|nr:PREDICTED: nuclear factor NF-kappa-B p110 subunit [Ceratosolen solmsi marchali]
MYLYCIILFIFKIVVEHTQLRILIQPVEKFRFRYKSEMSGNYSTLLGEREKTNYKKQVPTIQLVNCPFKIAVIRCTLVTADEENRFPHAHHLVRKNGNTDTDDPHDIEVSSENNFIAKFYNMGIIHTAKKHVRDEIVRRKRIELLGEKEKVQFGNATISTREDIQIKLEAERIQMRMNLNTVALCFQGFFYGENNVLHPFTEKVYSHPINNLKSALTGDLKICRIDKQSCSCEGNEEVFLLVEKVGKKNIKVKLYEIDNSDNIIWEAEGRFTELDVHHQYAIVFKTPPYKDTNITSPKEVFIRLERPTDGEVSNSVMFVYKPLDKNLNRKRPRLASTCETVESIETDLMENSSLENYSPMNETFVNLDNDISSLTGELKELLNDDHYCNSEDFKTYFSDLSTLESEKNFANDILQKVLRTLRDTALTDNSKATIIVMTRNILLKTTQFGDTALHFSLRHKEYKISKCIVSILSFDPLLSKIVNIQNSSGMTPLHLAVLRNQSDIVKALLNIGADPNLCDEAGATSLHNAVIARASGCIDQLLRSSKNVNLEAHTESGWTALHLAAQVGSLLAVHVLIKAGADVNSIDKLCGCTALHIAVDANHKHIVDYLLTTTKIDLNKKNFGGNTALQSAVAKRGKCAEDLIKIFNKYGADPKIRNNNIDRNDEEENMSRLSAEILIDISDSVIDIESSDSDDDFPESDESSCDLAQNDQKLMQLSCGRGCEYSVDEKLDSGCDMVPGDNSFARSNSVVINHSDAEEHPTNRATTIPISQKSMSSTRPWEDKLTDDHVHRIKDILERTGGWERLAQHTNHGSLVRLYRKTSSPCSALFTKIRLQQPDITLQNVKNLLTDVQEFEAVSALEKQ